MGILQPRYDKSLLSVRIKACTEQERHDCETNISLCHLPESFDVPHEDLSVYDLSRLCTFIRLYRLSVILELVYPIPSFEAMHNVLDFARQTEETSLLDVAVPGIATTSTETRPHAVVPPALVGV